MLYLKNAPPPRRQQVLAEAESHFNILGAHRVEHGEHRRRKSCQELIDGHELIELHDRAFPASWQEGAAPNTRTHSLLIGTVRGASQARSGALSRRGKDK